LWNAEVQYVWPKCRSQSPGRQIRGRCRHCCLFRPPETSPRPKRLKVSSWSGSFVTLNPRYVNMLTVNFSASSTDPDSRAGEARSPAPGQADFGAWDIIELLFFAYGISSATRSELEAFGSGGRITGASLCPPLSRAEGRRSPGRAAHHQSSRWARAQRSCSTKAISCSGPATTPAAAPAFTPPAKGEALVGKASRDCRTDRHQPRAAAGTSQPTAPMRSAIPGAQ